MTENTTVLEGWTGPGRCDATIEPLSLREDGLRSATIGRGTYEWWYFDAHLNTGHTIVVFFHASNPNPGLAGRTGIEIVLLRPDGKRVQKFAPHDRRTFTAERDRPEVTIGGNTLRCLQADGELPVYEIEAAAGDLRCRLTFRAEVNGWKPGSGLSYFGDMGYFGWVVPFARASVSGTVWDGNTELQVAGIGYHDHNWLNFPFQTIIENWMWGRIYSENFTVAYAVIQCNKKVAHHTVKVLMLAEGREVILSTGEFTVDKDDFEYNPMAKYDFPRQLAIKATDGLKATLVLDRVLEAQDMLDNFNLLVRLVAKRILRLKPGYLRLMSNFELKVIRHGGARNMSGSALHEIVMFRPVKRGSA